MQAYLSYIIPAVLTVLFNILFYISIKKTVDNSLEKFKISYSGVFKEKIDIYKSLLSEVYDLKIKLNQYHVYSNDEFKSDIKSDFNKLIRIYLVNSPFLSPTLIDLFKSNTTELQDIFEGMVLGDINKYGNLPSEEREKREERYWAAINKLRSNKALGSIEDRIIKEMRADLHTV